MLRRRCQTSSTPGSTLKGSTSTRLINPEDITIPTCVPGADEAIALIRRHHEVWLSTQTNLHRV